MKRKPLHFALGVALLSTVAFTFGGWAVVTVDDPPEYLEAGKPVDLSFQIRQHGVHPATGLFPKVTLRSGDSRTSVDAKGAISGRYVATVTAPRAGDWAVTIESQFGKAELLPVKAIAAGAQPPRPLAESERGHQLFYAKGCVSCHVRGDEGTSGMKMGPELTARRYVASYLSKFLADPAANPLNRATTITASMKMPNLDLKAREIASLVAFLNSEGQVSSK